MIKRLGIVILIVLALNFLAVGGSLGYLFGTGKLNKDKAHAIAKIVFPDPPPPATQPTTKPAADTGDPLFQLDELLEKQAGKAPAEQVAVVREAYESLAVQLDRQRREMVDMKRQVDLAQSQVMADRASIEKREKVLADRLVAQKKLDDDVGFKKSMALYDEMKPADLKGVLVTMDDATVVRYLQAMDPSRVSRIVKELTSPEELSRRDKWLDRMRSNNASTTQDASGPAGKSR